MKILLLQTSYLGDTILSTPVIAGIKALFPKSELWLLTTPAGAQLVQNDPLVTGVLAFHKRDKHQGIFGLWRMAKKLRSMQFDRVYALQRSYRTSLLLWLARIPFRIGFQNAKLSFLYHAVRQRPKERHDVLRNLSILEDQGTLSRQPAQLRLFAPPFKALRSSIQNRISNGKRYAVLVPGSAWRTKMWHWRGYRNIAQFLIDQNLVVITLGAEGERSVCQQVCYGFYPNAIDLSGKTSNFHTFIYCSK